MKTEKIFCIVRAPFTFLQTRFTLEEKTFSEIHTNPVAAQKEIDRMVAEFDLQPLYYVHEIK